MPEKYITGGFKKVNSNNVDDVGVVYVSENRVIRAIRPESVTGTMQILESGLIDELVQKNLFPETKISDVEVDDCPLVLEHNKIAPLIYPYEWSPEMLRRAALCVLEVNKCANAYGYELKDAHPYNVIFNHGCPQYVDFGSFAKRKALNSWVAYEEFINSYYRVLLLARKGLTSLFKHTFMVSGRGFNGGDMMVASSNFYSLLGVRVTRIMLKLFAAYQTGPTISDEAIATRFHNPAIRSLVGFILKSSLFPFRKINYDALERRIKSLKFKGESKWGDYHRQSGFYSDEGAIILTPRMEWVVNAVGDLSPSTILELAGNQGVLSRVLSRRSGVKHVVCSDYDMKSIDQLTVRLDDKDKVVPACFDFMSGAHDSSFEERSNRLRSDVVIALAVTHHLILAQHYSIESIFSTLASYTSRYLIVEFMPMGLWDGKSAPPLPAWYSESWFVENMSRYFKIINRADLEENRIIFIGEIIKSPSNERDMGSSIVQAQ